MPELLWNRYRDRKALQTYWSFYSTYKYRLAGVVFLFLIKSSPVYFIPIVTADIINILTEEGSGNFSSHLLTLFVIGSALILQNVPMHVWFARNFSRISRAVEEDLRTALCARLQHLSIHYHTANKMGVIQTKVLRDVENIESLTHTFFEGFPNLAMTLGIALAVTSVRAPLFIFFYLILVPPAVILYRVLRKGMRESNRDFRRSMEEMTGQVNEMLRLIPVTRAHNLEDREMERVNARLEQIRKNGFRMDNIIAVFGSINWTMMMFFNLLTLCTAAYLRHTGILPVGIGDIVLLSTYFGQITGCVMQLLGFFPAITKGMESVKSIGEILECPDIEQNENRIAVTDVTGDFRFENVSFRYEGSGKNALNEFTLAVRPGETIALAGASGAGKTTVAQLVIGFIRPTEGRILLDGKDMNTLDLRTCRKFISVVTQETILFDGSIRDNIAYGIRNPSDTDILDSIRAANLEDFLQTLPDGLNTQIRENGSRLSGGQRQRIAIARALIRNPKILILDEATSALDVDSESEIKESLERLMKGRTTFVIAHRLSTIRNADRIVVLDEGRILETGSHEELLARNGRYAEMYRKFVRSS